MQATRLVIPVAPVTGDGQSTEIFVKESYDDVINKLLPLTQPSSALEARALRHYEKADGTGRVWLEPHAVHIVEENAEVGE